MEIDRRSLLAGAGAALLSGLAERPAAALAASDSCILAPARQADGSYAVMVFSERGEPIRAIPLPGRGHDLAVHAGSGRAVVFARRPGTVALAFDLWDREEPQVFVSPPDRHFFGHGAFSVDGRVLFATENDYDGEGGVIGIYDAAGRYRRIGEFPCHGFGTHEAILLGDGRTLAVANGGIETNPTFGRAMLNIPDMDPSLVFIDVTSGHLLAQHRLPREQHQLSIRHMAVAADGTIWFGTQWEGDPLQTPPLVGRASMEAGLELAATPQPAIDAMRRYVGAMATSRDGTVICASAPRGGLVCYWSAETGKMLGTTQIEDCSGVTGSTGRAILAANGLGAIVESAPASASRTLMNSPGLAFDNHLRTWRKDSPLPKL